MSDTAIEPAETGTVELVAAPEISPWWQPTSLAEAQVMAEKMSKTGMVPKDFVGKPDAIVVAWSLGAPLGLSLLASLQGIAVINGRPTIWGDAALAVVKGNPNCKGVREWLEGEGDEMVAHCEVLRRGHAPVERSFSVRDAKRAKLWEKQGPWQQYPKRMLQMRARGFAIRDAFADALAGIEIREEVEDIQQADVVDVRDTTPAPEGETRTERLKREHRERKGEAKPDRAIHVFQCVGDPDDGALWVDDGIDPAQVFVRVEGDWTEASEQDYDVAHKHVGGLVKERITKLSKAEGAKRVKALGKEPTLNALCEALRGMSA